MGNLIIGEKQFQLKFQGKVSPKDYSLMLKILKSHKEAFSSDIFEILSLAAEDKQAKRIILNIFKTIPRNSEEIRKRILAAKETLEGKGLIKRLLEIY